MRRAATAFQQAKLRISICPTEPPTCRLVKVCLLARPHWVRTYCPKSLAYTLAYLLLSNRYQLLVGLYAFQTI